ncbi:hypothetical protein F4776DRAFT_668700 [Hypoxylon sp. NC0597]|nr:hypothetical protein F4776DRAFT_668700 [Hypoxylon sp. NC0597]
MSEQSLSPPEIPSTPPTSPIRKRIIESSSDEGGEKPSPSKVTRLKGPERLIKSIRSLKVNSSPTTHMSDVQNEPEAATAETVDEQAAEPQAQSKWLQGLPHALKLISQPAANPATQIQASLPEFQRVLENVKTSIQTPEDATELQKREDTKLAVLITRTLLEKFAETEKQITELREQAASLTKEDEEMDDPDTNSQGQVQDDNISAEDLAAQVRSILLEASTALENARKVADEMVTSNDGGVRDALEWWKSLAEKFPE